jgi:hypothetical protein
MNTETTNVKSYVIQNFKHKWANGINVLIVGKNVKTGKIKCVREDLTTQKFELSAKNLKMKDCYN